MRAICVDNDPLGTATAKRNARIESCIPLVYHIAKRIVNGRKIHASKFDEIIADGMMGVVNAACRYNGNHAFSTWAGHGIEWSIFAGMRRKKKEITTCSFKNGEQFFIVDAIGESDSYEQDLSEFFGCKSLRPREIETLKMRYIDGLTFEKCGIVLRISKERVRQIEVKALRKIRMDAEMRGVDFFDRINHRGRTAKRRNDAIDEEELSFDDAVKIYEMCE